MNKSILKSTPPRIFLIASFLILGSITPGFAQSFDLDLKGNSYLSFNIGATFLDDLSLSANQNTHGFKVDAAVDVTSDPGIAFSGAAGYIFSEYVRVELELGYTEVEADKMKGTGTITKLSDSSTSSLSAEANIDADASTFYTLGNLLISPFGKQTLTPFVGGGLGFASWESEVTKIGTTSFNGESDGTDFLGVITAGLDYGLTPNVVGRVQYRRFWLDSGKDGWDDAEGNNVVANLTYLF